ncbi:MAG: YbjN domain-containing protein [Candidatus Brocadiae bacterium]|nr:YbjN domain-containing protein [Candidatus Brocadiia bacterium]
MLLRCRACGNTYDVAGRQPGETFRSQCGDIIVVPQRGETAGAALAQYVERFGSESGSPLVRSGEMWSGKVASARVAVQADGGGELSIRAPFLNLPKRGTQLALRRVLELNLSSTGGARFALDGGQLFVVWSRPLDGLDYEEFVEGLRSVSRTRDDYDGVLRREWGLEAVESDTEEFVLPVEKGEEESGR